MTDHPRRLACHRTSSRDRTASSRRSRMLGGAARLALYHGHQQHCHRLLLCRRRVSVLRACRRSRAADAPAARRPGQHLPRAGDLQPAVHDARHRDDVPVRRAGRGGDGHPAAAEHARRTRSAFPAPFRLRVLGLPLRRSHLLRQLFFDLAPSGGWFMYPPLTTRTTRLGSTKISGCSASASSKSPRSPARSSSSSECCARAHRV